MRVGFIGTGMMGLAHVATLRDYFPRVEMVNAFDPHEESIRKARQAAPGLKICSSADELLSSDINAVVISTPGFCHAEDVERSLAAGKHILCEKPVMTTRQGCERVVQLADAHPDRVVLINHELRYANYFAKMKEVTSAGTVGEVQLVWCKAFRGPFLKKIGDWIQDSRQSGGAMVDVNSHQFDLMNWWVGSRPKKVCGFGGNDVVRVINSRHEVIDHASVSFEYENGVRGGLLQSMFAPSTGEDLEMGVLGTDGMIQTKIGRNEIWVFKRSSGTSEPVVHHVEMKKGELPGFREAHEAFFAAIQNKTRPLTDVRACVDGSLLAIAAEEAIATGRVVEL